MNKKEIILNSTVLSEPKNSHFIHLSQCTSYVFDEMIMNPSLIEMIVNTSQSKANKEEKMHVNDCNDIYMQGKINIKKEKNNSIENLSGFIPVMQQREESDFIEECDPDFMSGGTPLSLGESPTPDSLSCIIRGQLALFYEDGALYCKIQGYNKILITVDENTVKATKQGLASNIHERIMQYVVNDYVKPDALQFALNLGNATVAWDHYQEAYGGATLEDLEALREFISLSGYIIQ